MQTKVMVQMIIDKCHFSIVTDKNSANFILKHWQDWKYGRSDRSVVFKEKEWIIDLTKCQAVSIVQPPDIWGLNRVTDN